MRLQDFQGNLVNEPATTPSGPVRDKPYSVTWDVYVPIAIAAVPSAIFALLRLVTRGLDRPDAAIPPGVVLAMQSLILLGSGAMAVLALVRFDAARKQLSVRTNGNPSWWRKLALVAAMFWLLAFDVLTNLSTALAGAGVLLIGAVPAFLLYLSCRRLAFAATDL